MSSSSSRDNLAIFLQPALITQDTTEKLTSLDHDAKATAEASIGAPSDELFESDYDSLVTTAVFIEASNVEFLRSVPDISRDLMTSGAAPVRTTPELDKDLPTDTTMTTAKGNPSDDKLTELVQDLPPELFDMIFGLVFTTTRHFTPITKSYKLPPQLAVSRATRAAFAKSYFGNGTFRFHDSDLMRKWVIAMSTEHRKLLHKEALVFCAHATPACPSDSVFTDIISPLQHRVASTLLNAGVRGPWISFVSCDTGVRGAKDRSHHFGLKLNAGQWLYTSIKTPRADHGSNGPKCAGWER